MILLMPFFEPNGLSFIPRVDRIFTLLIAAAFMLAFALYIRSGLYSKLFLLTAVWRGALLISGLIAGHTVDRSFVMRSVLILGVLMSLELALRFDAMEAVTGLYTILAANLLVNLFTCINGGLVIRQTQLYYWNGMRTRFTDSIIPAIVLAFLISWKRKGRLLTPLSVATAAISAAQLLLQWVAAGMLALFALILFIFIFRRMKIAPSPVTAFLIPQLVGILIVFFRIQDLFRFIIVDLLHKDLTLHGRVAIWDQFLLKMKASPVIGMGEAGSGGAARMYWSARLLPAHNDILQNLYDGGIIGCALLAAILIYCAVRLSKYRGSMTALLLSAGFFAAGIHSIAEVSHYYIYFYILPFIAANAFYTEEQERQQNLVFYF